MTIEIHRPELEKLIQQRMESGAFRSVEDFLMHELISTPREAVASAKVQTSLVTRGRLPRFLSCEVAPKLAHAKPQTAP